MDVKTIIIIIVIILVIIAIAVLRVGANGRSIRKVNETTKDLGDNNRGRRENDIRLRREADALRGNNSVRRDIDRETKDILEGATHR